MTEKDKHDWVLIKPYYTSSITYQVTNKSGSPSGRKGNLGRQSTALGENAEWIQYAATVTLKNAANAAFVDAVATLYLSNEPFSGVDTDASESTRQTQAAAHVADTKGVKLGPAASVHINPGGTTIVSTSDLTKKFSGSSKINLCSVENTYIYYYLSITTTNGSSGTLTYDNKLVVSNDTTASKAPCTVYYFP